MVLLLTMVPSEAKHEFHPNDGKRDDRSKEGWGCGIALKPIIAQLGLHRLKTPGVQQHSQMLLPEQRCCGFTLGGSREECSLPKSVGQLQLPGVGLCVQLRQGLMASHVWPFPGGLGSSEDSCRPHGSSPTSLP
jgi:hypothetical protein